MLTITHVKCSEEPDGESCCGEIECSVIRFSVTGTIGDDGIKTRLIENGQDVCNFKFDSEKRIGSYISLGCDPAVGGKISISNPNESIGQFKTALDTN